VTTRYWDTSALVKRYCRKRGTQLVQRLLSEEAVRATSLLAYPELLAALARKRREGGLTAEDYRAARSQFLQDWDERVYSVVAVTGALAVRAGRLAEARGLKAMDALHLASALALQEVLQDAVTVVSSDAELLRAAEAEGLGALNPELT